MKICDITNFYHEKSGGVKTYIHQKMDYIHRYRFAEHLVIVPGDRDSEKQYQGSKFCQVNAPQLPMARPYRLILDFRRVNALIDNFNPDIIEIGCPYFLPWAVAVRRKRRCRLVGFYHSDFPRAYVRTADRVIGRLPASLLEKGAYSYVRAMYRSMDLTLAPSGQAASVLLRYGVDKVSVLNLGVNLADFNPGHRNPYLRTCLGIPPECVLLLFVGRFATEKGLDVLQQAIEVLAAEHPGRYHLLLIGEGPQGGALRDWAARQGSVTVGGYLQRKDLAEVYASADIFVTAGWAETFGLTILEAQASGLPVVTAASGAAAEAVAPGAGVLVEPRDPVRLAGAIARLSAQNLRSLGGLARRHVEVNYGWDKTFGKLFTHYERILERRPRWLESRGPSDVTGWKIDGVSGMFARKPGF